MWATRKIIDGYGRQSLSKSIRLFSRSKRGERVTPNAQATLYQCVLFPSVISYQNHPMHTIPPCSNSVFCSSIVALRQWWQMPGFGFNQVFANWRTALMFELRPETNFIQTPSTSLFFSLGVHFTPTISFFLRFAW